MTNVQNLKQTITEMPLPSSSDEPWRKINLKGFKLEDFVEKKSKTELELQLPEGASVKVSHFCNSTIESELEAKIKVLEAKQTGRQRDYFNTLSAACYQKGLYLHVSGIIKEPIIIKHSLNEGQLLATKVVIEVAPQASVTIIEEVFVGSVDKRRLVVPSSLVVAGANAQVKHIVKHKLAEHDWNFARIRFNLLRDSSVVSAWIHAGGFKAKTVIHSDIYEPGANFRGLGVKAANFTEFSDIDVGIHHFASHSQSSLLYKMVLTDKSHSVFTGNLTITPSLVDIDSHQENHNIILSDTARAESMPNLITLAEDVACEHGATVGALDEEAIFFLKARGLDDEQARNLLIEAFLESTLAEIGLDDLAEQTIKDFKTKLSL